MPWAASTTSTTPSQAARLRLTSYPKSTWPGVSIRWMTWPFQSTRTFCALIVMPRSRSMSIESRYCSRMSRASTAPVSSRMRSESVDLPWSTWAMIERLRMRSRAVVMGFDRPLSPSIAMFGINYSDQGFTGPEPADVLGDPPGQQRRRHLGRVADVRGDDAVRRTPKGMAIGQRFRVGDVEPGPADVTGLQRGHQVVGDDVPASGDVDQHAVVRH